MPEIFFFDTYAFVEVVRGNPNYKRFENSIIITTIFNLAELNYILKKEMSREKADFCTDQYSVFKVDVSVEDIKKAMDFKTMHRDFSIPDAVGYIIARKYGVSFVTGDHGFEGLPGVLFLT